MLTDVLLMELAVATVLLCLGASITLFQRLRPMLTGGAPFVASSAENIKRMMHLAELKPSDRVVDLGSGDGSLIHAASLGGVREAVGLELDGTLVKQSRRKTKGRENARFDQVDFWKADLSPYDVVFVFGIPYSMSRLAEKLQRELRPGTRVISNTFRLPGWKMTRSEGPIYRYDR